jgi:D-beta-D-heptose 7-phosphate kinase/D-beta-D-heptose 1-phosphate adenosyltransferase
LDTAGIDASGVVRADGRPTSVKTRIMVRGQQVARYDRESESPLDGAPLRSLLDALASVEGAIHALAIEDYDKGVLNDVTIPPALDLARGRGVPVVVDPKARNFFAYGGATVFKPNRAELESALREPVHADDPAWLEAVRGRLACEHLVVTLGEAGMAVAGPGGRHFGVIPTVARSVYDVSGAGDTVAAVLATALAAGFGVEDAATLANQAAGVQVGKAGVAPVTIAEIAEAAALAGS